MGLTGLQIQKLLPKTNCKECGSNTCLAFAMKLAAKKAELSACPYASEEAKKVLGAASEPPVKNIAINSDKSSNIGGETCLYRHEKTFVNQTLLAVNINDNESADRLQSVSDKIKDYELERVGEQLSVELIALTNVSADPESFAALAKKLGEDTGKPLILRSINHEALCAAAAALKGYRSILCSASTETIEPLKSAALENGHILGVCGSTLDEVVSLTSKLKNEGFSDLILEFNTLSLAEQFQTNSIARRAALKDDFKALGYPSIHFLDDESILSAASTAITEICKYGGICVLPEFDPALLAPLMTLRQNIYTDPQKPIQVEPKVYPVGEPNAQSPVFVTTNFSLTYFLVSGEIENSGTSAWLIVPECEGMSVLTSWAAGKFSGSSIATFIKESGFEDQVSTREIVIPGYVAQISGELEESLPGWKVLVGPQEAADIESFVKNRLLQG